MAMILTFRKERCKGCGLCVVACPKKLLVLEGGTNIKGYNPANCTDVTLCIGCASCARICPDSIITIEKEA